MNTSEDAMLRLEIERRTQEWNRKFTDLENQLRRKDAAIEEARNRRELQAFISRRIAEEADEIAPELIDFIQGDSVEAVEAAISTAKAKTQSILDGIREATAFRTDVPRAQPGNPQGQPGPGLQQQPQGQPSAQEIASAEVGSPEHLRLRAAYGIDRSRGRGIFG